MKTVTLEVNLSDALTAEELKQLLEISEKEDKPLGRVLLEGARALLESRKKAA